MITNKQKWVLGGLVTLSAAIWTPQVLERVGGDTSSQVGVDAGPNEEEMLSIEMETTGQLPGDSAPSARRLTGALTGGAGASTGLSAGNGELAPGGSTAIVSEVLRTLRQSEAFNVDSSLETPAASVTDQDPQTEVQVESEPPSLVAFLEENPLRGTIVGESTQMALIGKHRVHVGEVVPGTAATVTEIERGRATLVEGGMTLELELKPLETSEELMRARSQPQNTGTAEGPMDSNIPGGESAPEPTNDAPDSPSSELPGSTGDF